MPLPGARVSASTDREVLWPSTGRKLESGISCSSWYSITTAYCTWRSRDWFVIRDSLTFVTTRHPKMPRITETPTLLCPLITLSVYGYKPRMEHVGIYVGTWKHLLETRLRSSQWHACDDDEDEKEEEEEEGKTGGHENTIVALLQFTCWKI